MSKINLTFKGKKYAIDKSLLEGAIASLEGAFEVLTGEEVLAAGLYVDGVMIKSWDELINEGIITVEEGMLKYEGEVEMPDSDLFIILDDGTITDINLCSGLFVRSIF